MMNATVTKLEEAYASDPSQARYTALVEARQKADQEAVKQRVAEEAKRVEEMRKTEEAKAAARAQWQREAPGASEASFRESIRPELEEIADVLARLNGVRSALDRKVGEHNQHVARVNALALRGGCAGVSNAYRASLERALFCANRVAYEVIRTQDPESMNDLGGKVGFNVLNLVSAIPKQPGINGFDADSPQDDAFYAEVLHARNARPTESGGVVDSLIPAEKAIDVSGRGVEPNAAFLAEVVDP